MNQSSGRASSRPLSEMAVSISGEKCSQGVTSFSSKIIPRISTSNVDRYRRPRTQRADAPQQRTSRSCAPERAIRRDRVLRARSISSFRFMSDREDAERLKAATVGIRMSLLFQTEDPLAHGGIVLRIRNARPSYGMEDPGCGVPDRKWCSPASSLIPGPVDQSLFRNNPLPVSSVPPQEDILTRSHRLGGTTGLAAPATC